MADIADLFVELWHAAMAQEDQFLDAAEELSGADISKEVSILDELLGRIGLNAADPLQRWIASNSSILPGGRVGAMILAAQAIDEWYQPLTVNDLRHEILSKDHSLARLKLRLTGRYNEIDPGSQLIRKFPRWLTNSSQKK